MIELKFQIDESALAFHTIGSYTRDRHPGDDLFKSIQSFVERANQIDPHTCKLIEYNLDERSFLLQYGPNKRSAAELTEKLEQLAAKLKADNSFVAILQETEHARSKLQQEWRENVEKTNKIMTGLTGLPLDEHFDVFVIHPCFHRVSKSINSICCSYRQLYPDYNTQNLWYSIMSVLLEAEDQRNAFTYNWPVSVKGKAIRAVLDLLCFFELKNRMSLTTLPFPEQANLVPLRESWEQYINQNGNRDVHQYIEAATRLLEQLPENASS